MIFEALLNGYKNVVLFVVGLLPDFPDFSTSFTTSLAPIFQSMHSVCTFIDLKIVGLCFIILFVVMNIDFIFAVVMWIVRKIPGVS